MSTQENQEVKVAVAKTYLELISQDEKQVQKENLKIKAQESLLELNKKKLEVKKNITVLKNAVEKSKRAVPYNVEEEFKFVKDLEKLEDLLEFIEEVIAERFTDAII